MVRMPVISIGSAVAIAIPASPIPIPAVVASLPAIRRIVVMVAFSGPQSFNPYLPMAAPIPIPGHPDVAMANSGIHFNTRRRRPVLHMDVDRRRTCPRYRRRGQRARCNQRSRQQFPCERELSHDGHLLYRRHMLGKRAIGRRTTTQSVNVRGGTGFTKPLKRNL